MQDDGSIGARIAAERKVRGLTQHQLASRSHLSLSLLRKVEQGARLASPALVSSVARALRLEAARLTGQPYYSGSQRLDALHGLIPDLRRELTMFGLSPDEEPEPPLALIDLSARVAECSELLQAVDYARAGAVLPGLLSDLRALADTSSGADRASVMGMLRETYDNAKRLAYDLGYADLGSLAVSNAERAAAESGDPLAVAVTRSVRAWTLTGAGAYDSAYRLLVRTADSLDGDTKARWSVWGWLNLQAALSSARAGDASRTWEHHEAAKYAATKAGDGRDDFRLSFGPVNVAIWGVGLAVEMQDGPAAVALAEHVVLPPQLPRARAGHHYMDLARGQLYNGNKVAALNSLLTARRPRSVRALGIPPDRQAQALPGLTGVSGPRPVLSQHQTSNSG